MVMEAEAEAIRTWSTGWTSLLSLLFIVLVLICVLPPIHSGMLWHLVSLMFECHDTAFLRYC